MSKQQQTQVNEPKHEIEGEILLRETTHQKSARKSLTVPQKAHFGGASNASSGKDEETLSSTSTTSEVNSDDDAASIASRLSQIAVEQEERLHVGSPTESLFFGNPGSPSRTLKGSKSEQNIYGIVRPNSRFDKQEGSRALNSPTECLPEILIIDDDGRRQKKLSLQECQDSCVNQSAAHLPERGNLRQLESSRCSAAASLIPEARPRSNTAGNIMYDDNNQSILNIQRSTWTLSQFDETFNRNTSDSEMDANNATLVELSKTNTHSDPIGHMRLGGEKQQTNNLLIRASKNALTMSQSSCAQAFNNNEAACNKPNLTQRRSSHCHSIVLLGSSLESLCSSSAKRKASIPFDDKYKQEDDAGCLNGYCKCCRLSSLARYIPILDWLPRYKLDDFWGDLMAGVAVAVVNISTSLSAAVVAETSMGTAFRSSIINTLVFAILCSSRHTSFGSWSIMSQLLVVSVRKALSDELILNHINLGPSANWEPEEYEMWHMNIIILYAFLIGLVQLICGLLNLGKLLSSFIPEALCSSMIAATAFVMSIGQLANMCGTSNKILFSIEKNTTALWADLKSAPVDITDFFAGTFRWIQQIALLIKHSDQINLVCIIISTISVISLYLNQVVIQRQLARLLKRNIPVPFEMVLMIGTILASYWMDLENTYKVTTCGPIFVNFPMPNIPDLRLVRELWSDALATALISYTMVYIMAKTYGNKFNYEVDCNQELVACGAGNLIGGLFDALPATGSLSRSAVQVEAGGRTQMASIINCVLLYAIAQLLGSFATFLPVCVLSAGLFFGFVRMMSRMSEVLIYWRICKVDFAIWVVTFVSILALDMVSGFLYGFIFSILTLLYRAQNRRCYLLGTMGSSDVYVPLAKYPMAREIDGIKIFQFCGPIHYVCAEQFERSLRQKTRVNVKDILRDINDGKLGDAELMNLPTHIILDFSMISYVDSSGINTIKKLIEDYKRVNVTIFIASLASHVAAVVKSEPSLWEAYKERFYVTLADAVHCAIRDSQKRELGDACQVKA